MSKKLVEKSLRLVDSESGSAYDDKEDRQSRIFCRKSSIDSIRETIRNRSKIIHRKVDLVNKLREKSKSKISKSVAEKIIKRALSNEPIYVGKKTRVTEEGTAFTEEDFLKFEEEYSQ